MSPPICGSPLPDMVLTLVWVPWDSMGSGQVIWDQTLDSDLEVDPRPETPHLLDWLDQDGDIQDLYDAMKVSATRNAWYSRQTRCRF